MSSTDNTDCNIGAAGPFVNALDSLIANIQPPEFSNTVAKEWSAKEWSTILSAMGVTSKDDIVDALNSTLEKENGNIEQPLMVYEYSQFKFKWSVKFSRGSMSGTFSIFLYSYGKGFVLAGKLDTGEFDLRSFFAKLKNKLDISWEDQFLDMLTNFYDTIPLMVSLTIADMSLDTGLCEQLVSKGAINFLEELVKSKCDDTVRYAVIALSNLSKSDSCHYALKDPQMGENMVFIAYGQKLWDDEKTSDYDAETRSAALMFLGNVSPNVAAQVKGFIKFFANFTPKDPEKLSLSEH
jgi:hypothetical protein